MMKCIRNEWQRYGYIKPIIYFQCQHFQASVKGLPNSLFSMSNQHLILSPTVFFERKFKEYVWETSLEQFSGYFLSIYKILRNYNITITQDVIVIFKVRMSNCL